MDLAEVSRSRTVTIASSVANLALRTPGLSEGARDLARAIVELNSEQRHSAAPSPRHAGPARSTRDEPDPVGHRRRWFGRRR